MKIKKFQRNEDGEIILNPRQCALRRYLYKHRTEWVSSKTIAQEVAGYESKSTAYKQINEDYHLINMSGKYDKIIIADRVLGYKLATKKEFEAYAKTAYAESISKIVYISRLIKTAKMDGQGIIPGLEGYQREFYEKFVEELNPEPKPKETETEKEQQQ